MAINLNHIDNSILIGTSEKLRIHSTGQMQIGGTTLINTDPLLTLGQSASSVGNQFHLVNDGSADLKQIFISAGKASRHIGIDVSTNNFFVGRDNVVSDLVIDSSGRLLLGTTTVYGATGGGTMMVSVKGDATSRTDISISNQSSADNASAAVVLATHGQDYILEATGSGNTTDGVRAFRILNGTSERLRIHSDGKIAIGSAETSTGLLLLDKTLTAESDASDKNNYHLVVRSQTNSNTSKIGIAFANTTDDTHVGASILHHRESTDSIGSLAFYTSPSSGTTTERMKIDRNGQVTKPASCAFNVTPNGNQSLGNGETLTSWKTTDSRGFENTTTGGYFGSGIFTAPVTGAYYFTSNILLYDTNGTNSIHLYWQKNGSGVHTYCNTRFNSGDFGYGNYMPVAGACTMYMSAGDTCRIRISFSGSNCGMYGNDQNWGNWGGFLIG